MGSSDLVTVIVLAWNQVEATVSCLRSLADAHCGDSSLKILLVDNGSTEGTAQVVRERFPQVKVLRNADNLGYAGGNNVGIRHALEDGADYICILNNDVTVASGFLGPLLSVLEKQPGAGIAAPLVCEMDDRRRVWSLGAAVDWHKGVVERLHAGERAEHIKDRTPFEVDVVPGTAFVARREVFDRAGLFDDAFYLYFEETDWCLRARNAGYRIMAVPSAVVWHQVSGTLGQSSPAVDYYMLRNHLRFLGKHWSGLRRWYLLGRTVASNLLTITAYTATSRDGQRLPHRNARLFALRDAALGRWGKMGPDVEAVCYGRGR